MNKDKLKQLREHILKHPEKFKYAYWYIEAKHPNTTIEVLEETNTDPTELFKFTNKIDSVFSPSKVLDLSCNTLCCVAGTTCALWFEELENKSKYSIPINEQAGVVLGLTPHQANMLFYASSYFYEDSEGYIWEIENKLLDLCTHHDAIERIDFLLSLPEGAE